MAKLAGVYDKGSLSDEEVFQKLKEVSDKLEKQEIIGCFLRFPVASGYAYYLVTKDRPLTLQWVPIFDQYAISDSMIRGLRIPDILKRKKSK